MNSISCRNCTKKSVVQRKNLLIMSKGIWNWVFWSRISTFFEECGKIPFIFHLKANNSFYLIYKPYDFITSFECPDFSSYDKNKCHLSGKSFNVGDEIKDDMVPKCRAACRCSKHGDAANIECANVECPELFGRRNWDCLSIYENPKQCCRSEEICGSLWFCTYIFH